MNSINKESIKTSQAPAAIGPYSVAIKAGSHIFASGQIGLNPITGNMVEGGVEAEAKQALNNLKNILEAAGSSMEKVVKTTVFLVDMNDFAKMNAVYAGYFSETPPARSAVQVGALPKNALVEIEAIALS